MPLDVKIVALEVLESKDIQIEYFNILGTSKSKLLASSRPDIWPLDVKIFDLEFSGSKIFDLEVLGSEKTKLKILTSWGHPNRSFLHPADPSDGPWMLKYSIWRFGDPKKIQAEILLSRGHAPGC